MSTESRDLAGMRLGVLERTILVNAPPLGTLGGLCIKAPEGTRSAQQAYLRASKKLATYGLVHRKRIRQPTRASDPRRQHPLYRDGAFWHRPDPTRVHRIARVFVWATSLGEGIRMAYGDELTSGRPIRWSWRAHRREAQEIVLAHPRAGALRRRRLDFARPLLVQPAEAVFWTSDASVD